MRLFELGSRDRRLDLGNPATDKSLKDYLRVGTMEQLQAQVQLGGVGLPSPDWLKFRHLRVGRP